MTKLEKLLNEVRKGDNTNLLKSVVNDINSYDGSLDYLEFYGNDEDFFSTFFNGNPMEVARSIFYGDYRYCDDYVKFNGYGNLESVSEWEYEEELKGSANDIAQELERLIDENSLDIDDYDYFIDYEEDEEETESETE